MSVTLRDVAKLAEVAPNTASSILTGRKDSWASAATRERVIKAARTLGYKANPHARSLRTGRSHTIGLILPDLLNPVYVTFARCIEDLLESRGYTVLIEDVKADTNLEKIAITKLFAGEVDGVLGFLLDPESHKTPFSGSQKAKPTVLFGANYPGTLIDNISVDFSRGTTEAIEHLVELGHHRIGFVCGLPHASRDDSRVQYFRDVLKQHDLNFDRRDFVRCSQAIESAWSTFSAYLAETPVKRRMTAVFAINDILAIGTIRAALDHGLRIPQDLSVIGVDDIPLSRFLSCPLSTVSFPILDMATKAVEFLVERIEAKRQPKRREVLFPTHLIKRASTAVTRS